MIEAVDGSEVNTPAEMIYRLLRARDRRASRVTVARRGEARDVEVALIARARGAGRARPSVSGEREALPGLKLAHANPAVIAEMGLPLMTTGVVVLDPGPWGARAGLAAGRRHLGRQRLRGRGAAGRRALPCARPRRGSPSSAERRRPPRHAAVPRLSDGRSLRSRAAGEPDPPAARRARWPTACGRAGWRR